MGLYDAARKHPRVQVVAACEEDAQTRATLKSARKVQIRHERFEEMLRGVECDAIAVGDYFAKRGALIIAALQVGKHVLADKPICTDLRELDEIEKLSNAKSLAVGCLLDLRDLAPFITMRKLIAAGEIGEMHTVLITAQHPLLLASRPKWYFEDGKHGGTINDIGVHAIDLIPWMTGRKIVETVAARAWNARLKEHPKFLDAAQFLLKLDNGGGVFCDVSYLAPDGVAYKAPQYWRITCHGNRGVVETSLNDQTVKLARAADKVVNEIPFEPPSPNGCLEAFMREIEGKPQAGDLTTRDVLHASRQALMVQQVADQSFSSRTG